MSAPMIARGSARECLGTLLDLATLRAETDPERAPKWRKLQRYLVQRLARRIMREAGRPMPSRRGQHGR